MLLNKLFDTIVGVTYEAQKYISALLLIEKYKSIYQQTPFMEICEVSITQNLLISICKIFDNHKASGKASDNINACFQTLKKELNSYPDLQRVIDSLCEEYEQTIPRKVRNKVLAHLDLNAMQNGLPFAPRLSSLEQLVNHTCDTLTLISHYIYPGDVIFPDTKRLVSQIESYFPFNI